MTWLPGDVLAVDDRKQPRVTWLAYCDGDRLWARPYVNGRLLHYDSATDRWYLHGLDVRIETVAAKVVDRVRALLPVELPVHPDVEPIDPHGWRNRPALGAYRKPEP
jgi:hypothetical protein